MKIVTQLDSSGRPLNSGLAYVRFESAAEAQRAAAMQHRKTMGNRYIECLPVSPTQRMACTAPVSSRLLRHETSHGTLLAAVSCSLLHVGAVHAVHVTGTASRHPCSVT